MRIDVQCLILGAVILLLYGGAFWDAWKHPHDKELNDEGEEE